MLLAAVATERDIGDTLVGAEERRRLAAAEAAGKLTLAADELPQVWLGEGERGWRGWGQKPGRVLSSLFGTARHTASRSRSLAP